MQLYAMDRLDMPWGDYGLLLQNGMSRHRGRLEGRIQLERTGPFIAGFTFPGGPDVIVTNAVRRALEQSKLTGMTFAPVDKAHIVELAWQDWDRTASAPPKYPDSGDPEDYVLGAPHSQAVADRMGDLWELVVGVEGSGRSKVISKQPRRYDIVVTLEMTPPSDVLRARGLRQLIVNRRAKDAIEKIAEDCVLFTPVRAG